jgi:uncharacterized protein (DUF2236 family)
MASVRAWLGHELFRRVAGPDGPQQRERIHGTPGPRWFDADSEIVRVHGDAAMFIGGIRAILLQTMHPAAMQAVADHSGYRGDMWGRLARTSQYLAVTTFGTAEHAEQAIRAVQSIHERVTGTMPDGTPYAASDPHLLGWVHVAEVDSFLRAHTAYGRHPLDAAGRDEYVAQAAVIARKLGVVDPPLTEAALAERLADYRPELRATDHAREAVKYVVVSPPLPLAARPAYGVLVAAAVGLLPRWTRKPLRLPSLPVTERTVVRAGGSLATGTIRWAMSPGRAAARELAAARLDA